MRVLLLALRRLAASLPTLCVVLLVALFLLLQLAPGDTVDALVAQIGGGDPAMIDELRRFYGLDVSVAVQLGRYLWRLLQLDLGFSAIYGKPVASVILERLPATLLLMGSALSFAFAGGMALGRPRGAAKSIAGPTRSSRPSGSSSMPRRHSGSG